MKSVELNQEGNFDSWDFKKVEELRSGDISTNIGQNVLFENNHVCLWEIHLLPNQRLPFRKQIQPHVWVCEKGGLAITRYANAKIDLLYYEEGDTAYLEPKKNQRIYDLENIGEDVLQLVILEFKQPAPIPVDLKR
ncbi:MAG: hypothetical protein AAGB24_15840 [Bacteroidota bacterium]